METCGERRKRKLEELCENTEGGLAAIAEAAGLNPASLDQILKGVLLPQKKDGTRVPRSLGDEAARKIEEVYQLPRGWFDSAWPLPLVNQARYEQLSDEDKIYVQAKMNAAIEEREGASKGASGHSLVVGRGLSRGAAPAKTKKSH